MDKPITAKELQENLKMSDRLSYEEWEKWFIDTQCSVTEEEIEEMKTKYYFGINTYDDFKRLLRHEYELYCEEND